MKRMIALTAVFALITALFSSCSSNNTELRNRLIIEGMGVDRDEDGFVLTVQALNTTPQSQGSDQTASSGAVIVYTVKGNSVSDALSKLRLVSGKNPLYSQNRIIIIGSSVENEIPATVDFFVREYASRINVLVAVSENKASAILNSQSESEAIGAKSVQEIIEQGKLYSYAGNSEIYALMNDFSDKNAGVCIPLLGTEKGVEGEDKETVNLKGARVFKNGKAQCSLTNEEVSYLLLSTGKSGKCEIAFKDSDSVNVTVEILKSRTKVKTGKKDLPNPKVEIKLNLSAGVLEYASGTPDGLNSEKLGEINALLKEKIESDMSELYKKMLKEEKTDVFRFDRRFSLTQSKKYYEFEDEWDSVIGNIEPKITVDIDLKRIGINSAKFS